MNPTLNSEQTWIKTKIVKMCNMEGMRKFSEIFIAAHKKTGSSILNPEEFFILEESSEEREALIGAYYKALDEFQEKFYRDNMVNMTPNAVGTGIALFAGKDIEKEVLDEILNQRQ